MKSLLLIVVILFTSCASRSGSRMVTGKYYKKGPDFDYTLLLNGDSTFALSIKYQDAMPACNGKWHYVD